jgi:hypothetical protein
MSSPYIETVGGQETTGGAVFGGDDYDCTVRNVVVVLIILFLLYLYSIGNSKASRSRSRVRSGYSRMRSNRSSNSGK